jgi:hypothetical protein
MTNKDTHDAARVVDASRAGPGLTREPLLGGVLALLTLTAIHQIRPLPWPIWTTWGAITLVAAAQSVRSRRRCDPTTWASDHVLQRSAPDTRGAGSECQTA